jgi:hypothetical protein
MAVDQRRRQKKLERKKAKQKAQRRELARRESRGLAARLEDASAAPVLHCCIAARLWASGIGHVLLSRKMPNGNVAFACFLVDAYCLGVKDAFWNVTSRTSYDDFYANLGEGQEMTRAAPEYARKLVEDAIRYALDLGISPHSDYREAKLIFGDISADLCLEEFTFGKDGQPFFVAGPYDRYERCQQILRTLAHRCGPDGYHYLVPITSEWPLAEEQFLP